MFWSQSKQQRVLYAMSVSLDAQAYAKSFLAFGGECSGAATQSVHTQYFLLSCMHACNHTMNGIQLQLHITKGNEVVAQPSAVLSGVFAAVTCC